MTPLIRVDPRDKREPWAVFDMRDDERVCGVVVIPTFGRDHHAGVDCWCHPTQDGRLFSHNAEN